MNSLFLGRTLFFLMAVAWCQFALAWDTSQITQEEIAKLPLFCQEHKLIAAQSQHQGVQEPSPEMLEKHKAWAEKFGPIYEHMHHYCWGMNKVFRYYYRFMEKDSNSYLDSAAGEYTYVINHLKQNKNNPRVAADIYLQRGKVYLLMNKYKEALTDFYTALGLDSTLSDAYVGLYDIYSAVNNNKKAIEILKKGLDSAPLNKALRRRAIDNKLELPAPRPETEKDEPGPEVKAPEPELPLKLPERSTTLKARLPNPAKKTP